MLEIKEDSCAIGRNLRRIHIYDETEHRVICDSDFFNGCSYGWSKRKKHMLQKKIC